VCELHGRNHEACTRRFPAPRLYRIQSVLLILASVLLNLPFRLSRLDMDTVNRMIVRRNETRCEPTTSSTRHYIQNKNNAPVLELFYIRGLLP
jgi:hypothetical protein